VWLWLQGYPVRRSVIVSSKSGNDFRGVLWRQEGRYLVLRNAELLRTREAPLPVDGEVVIPRENVEFIQVLGG
jgi:hypothetical protein